MDITEGGDFLGLCEQKSSYQHVSDFGRLRSYDRLKLRGDGNCNVYRTRGLTPIKSYQIDVNN